MSNEALTWAFAQQVEKSSAKFVLVVLADESRDGITSWCSAKRIAMKTGQDVKTVDAGIRRLRDAGFIVDTRERAGNTGSCIVWAFSTPKNGGASDVDSTTKYGGPSSPADGPSYPENGGASRAGADGSSTENGGAICGQPADLSTSTTGLGGASTEGSSPVFPGSSPKFPSKLPQISREAPPNLGDGAQLNPLNPKSQLAPAGARLAADWNLPEDLRRWTETERPDIDVDAVLAKFREHWTAQLGPDSVSCDWCDVWRRWVRNERRPRPRAALASVTVPGNPGRDPALLKIDQDKLITGPPPPAIRAQLAKLRNIEKEQRHAP